MESKEVAWEESRAVEAVVWMQYVREEKIKNHPHSLKPLYLISAPACVVPQNLYRPMSGPRHLLGQHLPEICERSLIRVN